MALKITKSIEPIQVSTLTVCIYSPPGIGKTSMGFTAGKPLLLDFDRGAHRSKNRKDVVRIEKWTDVTAITAEDLKDYSTVIVDTAGRALDVLTADIIAGNPKMGRGGALSLQGYGELRSKFVAWTKHIRSFGLDVVLLAHSEEQKNGDEVIERLDMQGGSKGEVYKVSDVMGRIYLTNGRRTLNLSPSETSFGKNPAGLPPLEVPDYATTPDFLAGVIAQTKASLNAQTEEQAKASAAMGEWAEKIQAAGTADEFNALIEPIKGAAENIRNPIKLLLVKVAKERGIEFDKAAGTFAPPKQAQSEGAAENSSSAQSAGPSPSPSETKPDRVPGEDDGDEEANRKAAEPTPAEIEAHEAAKGKPGRKAKAA